MTSAARMTGSDLAEAIDAERWTDTDRNCPAEPAVSREPQQTEPALVRRPGRRFDMNFPPTTERASWRDDDLLLPQREATSSYHRCRSRLVGGAGALS